MLIEAQQKELLTYRNTHTHTERGCFKCVAVVDHLYLHLTFPPFVSLQLSVSGLSVCCVFLASSSPLPLFSLNPLFSRLPSTSFFHSVSCHCLSALSHSQHSSLSPSLASFSLTGAFLVFHSLQLHLPVFSFDLSPSPLFVIFFFFLPIIFSSTFLPFSPSIFSSLIFIMRKAAGES